MKILLLGKNGQVGWELQRALSILGEVVALDRHPASTPTVNLKVICQISTASEPPLALCRLK